MSKSVLPYAARTKLTNLEVAADTARGAEVTSQSRISDLRKALQLNPEGPNAEDQKLELASFEASLRQHRSRHRELADLLGNVRLWVAQVERAGLPFEMADEVKLKAIKGESLADAIKRTRDELGSVQQHLRVIQYAPLPKADLKARAKVYAQQLATAGRPHMDFGRGEFNIRWNVGGLDGKASLHILAVMAWADRDKIEKALIAQIDAMPDDATAMGADEKKKRIAELTEAVDRLERSEEALIEIALERGQFIPRRPNASPLALLGIQRARQKKVASVEPAAPIRERVKAQPAEASP